MGAEKTDVYEYHVDTFVMGDDWKGKFDYLKEEGIDVVYLERTPEISTTQIKQELKGEYKKKDNIMFKILYMCLLIFQYILFAIDKIAI